MIYRTRGFYAGAYRYLSIAAALAIAVGGWFYPPLGLAVPALMLTALVFETRGPRRFCSSACPNGRAMSFALARVSRGAPLPRFVSAAGFRRALCGFMLFCVANLLFRYGGGGVAAVARVFWAVYALALGLGFAVGAAFRPRAFCAFCPMGTLQDTVGGAMRKLTPPA